MKMGSARAPACRVPRPRGTQLSCEVFKARWVCEQIARPARAWVGTREAACAPRVVALVMVVLVIVVAGCKREERGFRVSPPQANVPVTVNLTDLHPAGSATNPPV